MKLLFTPRRPSLWPTLLPLTALGLTLTAAAQTPPQTKVSPRRVRSYNRHVVPGLSPTLLTPSASTSLHVVPGLLPMTPTAPAVPQTITEVQISPQLTSATFAFLTATATVPQVQISRRRPDAGPSFRTSRVVLTGTPLYSGPRTGHRVKVEGLESGKHYYYIIAASGDKGMPVRVTGDFTTSVGID